MTQWITGSLRFVAKSLVAENSAKQIAMAVALGVAFGLLPKANLTALLLLTTIFAVRVHLATALGTAFCVSLVGPLFDPVLHQIGKSLLTTFPFAECLGGLYRIPYFPWTAIHNTVVLGALTLGLVQIYPTYRLTQRYLADNRNAPAGNLGEHFPLIRRWIRAQQATSWRIG